MDLATASPDVRYDCTTEIIQIGYNRIPGSGYNAVTVNGYSPEVFLPDLDVEENSPLQGTDVHVRAYWAGQIPASSPTVYVTASGYGSQVIVNPDDQCCAEGDEMTAPDSYSISAGGNAGVYVTGGCPPFSWVISGEGLSIGHNSTDERANTVFASRIRAGISLPGISPSGWIGRRTISKRSGETTRL